jgi:hypothetical protein
LLLDAIADSFVIKLFVCCWLCMAKKFALCSLSLSLCCEPELLFDTRHGGARVCERVFNKIISRVARRSDTLKGKCVSINERTRTRPSSAIFAIFKRSCSSFLLLLLTSGRRQKFYSTVKFRKHNKGFNQQHDVSLVIKYSIRAYIILRKSSTHSKNSMHFYS